MIPDPSLVASVELAFAKKEVLPGRGGVRSSAVELRSARGQGFRPWRIRRALLSLWGGRPILGNPRGVGPCVYVRARAGRNHSGSLWFCRSTEHSADGISICIGSGRVIVEVLESLERLEETRL